ncbi:MAG TPA: hypothetical protein VFT62_02540 [Mycobacteriales bacterium]|nr:hypothetical protein [Mycobacteriales bacterium]
MKEKLKGEFWRPKEQRLLVRRGIGWGWTVNFAELARRLRERRP